jgi:UDP-GlcNAc:undecaprenyl-phosphate GlcNAc-1-phosphate transferase
MVAFLVSFALLTVLYPVAPRLGLVDHPSVRRKIHSDPIPLIGGLAIFGGILASNLLILSLSQEQLFGLLGGALLVSIGALDDRLDLGPKLRFAAQIGAALLLSVGGGVTLTSLGDLLGFGPIYLGAFSVPFTVFAMVGIINAFNMIDGIDGLAGGLMLIGVCALLCLSSGFGPSQVMMLSAVAALIPYLIFNLGFFGCTDRKVFLGDAGSMLLGYLLVWALIDAAESERCIDAVTALWITAIPLMDTLSVMGRRTVRGISPFSADRAHLHHVLVRITGSTRKTLGLILALALVLAFVGVLGRINQVDPHVMFYAGISIFIAYLVFLRQAPKLYKWTRRRRRLALSREAA